MLNSTLRWAALLPLFGKKLRIPVFNGQAGGQFRESAGLGAVQFTLHSNQVEVPLEKLRVFWMM